MRRVIGTLMLSLVLSEANALELSDLDKGRYPELQFLRISPYDVAEFEGTITLSGRFIAEWALDSDEDRPSLKTYRFLLENDAVDRLPRWAQYRAKHIDIVNGQIALVMLAGANVAEDFEGHRSSKVVVSGTITLSMLKVWVECEAPNATARVDAVKEVTFVEVSNRVANMGCSGPYED